MRKDLDGVVSLARKLALLLLGFNAIAAIAAPPLGSPFGTWTRRSPDPIVSPRGDGFESAGTFNPAVIKKDAEFVMLYRAQDRQGSSSLGYATSRDGIHFERRS